MQTERAGVVYPARVLGLVRYSGSIQQPSRIGALEKVR